MRATSLVSCVLFAASFSVACDTIPEPAPEPRPAVSAAPEVPEPPDLIQEDLVVGTGAEAKTGDKVTVHYTGRLLKTNFMFDSSVGKSPFPFTIGEGGARAEAKKSVPRRPAPAPRRSCQSCRS
jgi:FKBP-type peptidyl-prolyl cis-trans isomerase FkpA